MRIVIDMQGRQSSGSQNRGIGRYTTSLVQAIIRNNSPHEIILVLNAAFPESIEAIRDALSDQLPAGNIKVWSAVVPTSYLDPKNKVNRKTTELIREAFISNLKPDVVLITSLFEGHIDDAVTSIGLLSVNYPVAVVLYDLIPFIHRKPYLENPEVKAWYLEKITYFKKADCFLGISESSCQEGIKYLGLKRENTVDISTDADPQFKKINITGEQEKALREKYQVNKPFVMYTGGIDHRKNIDGLIRAFAKLPASIQTKHQLVIVCSIQPASRKALTALVLKLNLSKEQVVFTGYVPEEDLIAFYNITHLFIFPSWHEGFGLPLLEAMRCGAPAISANLSSLPEVIGWQGAQFDPHNEQAMSNLIEKGLTDESYRQQLIDNATKQSKRFSWDKTALQAIAAMEKAFENKKAKIKAALPIKIKPKLAYISPLPPEQSGIADYSAELLPHLAEFYEIEVIINQASIENDWINKNCAVRTVDWFASNSKAYDRVLYHFGNSDFHQHMFDLLYLYPGVVVLHDFYLSGIVHYMEATGYKPSFFLKELYYSHGFHACKSLQESTAVSEVIRKYPVSLSVVENSKGMIVHSQNSLQLARKWYGLDVNDWSVIPLLRETQKKLDKNIARAILGLPDEAFVICSFGGMAPTKLNDRLLTAWLHSALALDQNCFLVFVGQNDTGEYGSEISLAIENAKLTNRIIITGWADQDTYHQYLAAADIGVQLRTLSRGETSAAVLDCMNFGLPTIVNANGSMADLDQQAVWMLPDEFADSQLIEALENLWVNDESRQKLSTSARKVILHKHDPATCASAYKDAIEKAYSNTGDLEELLPVIENEMQNNLKEIQFVSIAAALSESFPNKNRQKQLLVDISELVEPNSKSTIQREMQKILKEWLLNPLAGYRIEPVYATTEHSYRYARKFTSSFLNIAGNFTDESINAWAGDVFVFLDLQHPVFQTKQSYLQELRNRGVMVKSVVYDLLPDLLPDAFVDGAKSKQQTWLEETAKFDGVICISKSVADEYQVWKQNQKLPKRKFFSIDWLHLGADIGNTNSAVSLPKEA